MRTIERNMIAAINARKTWKSGNTRVEIVKGTTDKAHVTVYLHNNAIAGIQMDGSVHITLAGWPTATTRSRLNAILRAFTAGCSVYQRRHSQFFARAGAEYEIASDEWIDTLGYAPMQSSTNGF